LAIISALTSGGKYPATQPEVYVCGRTDDVIIQRGQNSSWALNQRVRGSTPCAPPNLFKALGAKPTPEVRCFSCPSRAAAKSAYVNEKIRLYSQRVEPDQSIATCEKWKEILRKEHPL
jgi:hypothetical protein